MTYDYFAINFTSVVGFFFLLIFLYANASLEAKIKRIFYVLILLEFVEAVTYSLELWTTTFENLSPLRLWLSAIGYAVRPYIFCLMLMLAMRNKGEKRLSKVIYIPAIINTLTAFSVFFTDIVYSYTLDNQFVRGPLGYITYIVVILYLIVLMVVVVQNHTDHSKLEIMIIFAISVLLFCSMAIEAVYAIRTINRTSIIMATIFYYMFFQTQIHKAAIIKEQGIRRQLEHSNKIDGNTGLLNKQAFNSAAQELLSENLSSVGVLFVDLDHLKELNDTLGHAMGDIAIADTAKVLQTVFRKTDLIGRFGGDEFYVLLPNIPLSRLQVCLQELLRNMQRTYSVQNTSVNVSASIGAVYTENPSRQDFDKLVHMADEALYEAKAAGRNRVVIREQKKIEKI